MLIKVIRKCSVIINDLSTLKILLCSWFQVGDSSTYSFARAGINFRLADIIYNYSHKLPVMFSSGSTLQFIGLYCKATVSDGISFRVVMIFITAYMTVAFS